MTETIEKIATYEVTSLSQAAFLHMKGLKVIRSYRRNRRDKIGPEFGFEFEDPEGTAASLVLEYLNSECANFDDACKRMRQFLHANK